jgi:hypothetical protein
MKKKIKSALNEAIFQSLPTLNKLAFQCIAPYQVLRKKDNGWRGEYQQKTDPIRVFFNARNYLNVVGADFTNIFFENHPEYKGTIHCSGLGVRNPHCYDTTHIFRALIQHLWERYETFDCDEAAVNSIVEEFSQFVNQPTIRYRFQAQLPNFNMSEAYLTLPNNLIVRRLDEKELSVIHFGSITRPGSNLSLTEFIHEFVLEREDKIPVIFGDCLDDIDHPIEKIRALFDDTILALRTFKEGMIGYSFIHCKPLNFCPFLITEIRSPGEHIPFDRYELLDNEITKLNEYVKDVFKVSEPSMVMALSRLADAEIRTRPQDKIMDAVVGMEALLLAGLGKEDRRGELKYRFSIHFSTLFQSPQDRHNAFRIAKDLYDLRSTIAHGSRLTEDKFRIGDEKGLNLVEASKRATKNLRIVIRYFLPKVGSATYKNHEFWERAYFNLENISSNP